MTFSPIQLGVCYIKVSCFLDSHNSYYNWSLAKQVAIEHATCWFLNNKVIGELKYKAVLVCVNKTVNTRS